MLNLDRGMPCVVRVPTPTPALVDRLQPHSTTLESLSRVASEPIVDSGDTVVATLGRWALRALRALRALACPCVPYTSLAAGHCGAQAADVAGVGVGLCDMHWGSWFGHGASGPRGGGAASEEACV